MTIRDWLKKPVRAHTYSDGSYLIDIHNALHALGLRSDEQAEEFDKKHVIRSM